MRSLLRLFMLLVVVVTSTCSVACNAVFGLDELVLKEDAGDVPRDDGGRDATGGGSGDVATDGAGGGANDATSDPSDMRVAADADAATVGDATPDGPPFDGGRTDTPGDVSKPPADAPSDVATDAVAVDGDAPRDNGPIPTDAPDAGDAADGGIVDPLMSIAITPANSSVARGSTRPLTATGTYAVSGAKNITTLVNWSTNDATVAGVGDATGTKGIVSGNALGTAIITAALGSVSGTTNITVTMATLVSIAVTPSNSTVPLGSTVPFTAMGTFSDASTQDVTASAVWTATAGVASMSSAPCCPGVASTVGVGTATITATIGTVSGGTSLMVGPAVLEALAVTPPNPSVYVGATAQFRATGTYSDNSMTDLTSSVTWQSSNPGVASVSDTAGTKGLATGITAGATTISATSGTVSGSTVLSVATPDTLNSITLAPDFTSIMPGQTQQYVATGHYSDGSSSDLTSVAKWLSDTPSVATVDMSGLATAQGAGQTIISASYGVIVGTATLLVETVSP